VALGKCHAFDINGFSSLESTPPRGQAVNGRR
jgi:hypothetical protein